jgi:hypothetical protein
VLAPVTAFVVGRTLMGLRVAGRPLRKLRPVVSGGAGPGDRLDGAQTAWRGVMKGRMNDLDRIESAKKVVRTTRAGRLRYAMAWPWRTR